MISNRQIDGGKALDNHFSHYAAVTLLKANK